MTDTTKSEEPTDLPPMPALEGDEEEKEGIELKTLLPNKLLTRLPILLLQIQAQKNSFKIKNEVRLLCVSIIKSPKKFKIM